MTRSGRSTWQAGVNLPLLSTAGESPKTRVRCLLCRVACSPSSPRCCWPPTCSTRPRDHGRLRRLRSLALSFKRRPRCRKGVSHRLGFLPIFDEAERTSAEVFPEAFERAVLPDFRQLQSGLPLGWSDRKRTFEIGRSEFETRFETECGSGYYGRQKCRENQCLRV